MHEHDWIERVRRAIWPKLGLSGYVGPKQYVGHLLIDVEEFEAVLHRAGVIRNAPAYYKRNQDGQQSVGSWVYLPDGYFGTWQEHLTLFPDDVLAVHKEYNWRRHPVKHLRANVFTYPIQEWRDRLARWGVPYRIE